jgi:DNA-binding MarR family transcriptional regulator
VTAPPAPAAVPVYGDPALDRAAALSQHLMVLSRTMQSIKTAAHARQDDGVSMSTYVLLFHLIAQGPMRPTSLAESACVDPSTISRQVDQLVRLGHVARTADPDDGRATLLVATDQGRATHARMRENRDRLYAGLLAHWDDDDVATLTALLGRLTGDLSDALPRILAELTAPTPDGTTR